MAYSKAELRSAGMRVLRQAQTHLPFLRPVKFDAYNLGTRLFGMRIEPEFLLLNRLGPIRLAVDIGGNWGQSIYAIRRTARPEQIVSFEPNAILAGRLIDKFRNDPGVRVHACALSDADGTFDLYVPRYRKFLYDGLASLDEDEARGWLNAHTMAGFDPGKLTIEHHPVQVRRLDDFGLDPQVIKIDVQGMEASVIRGGLETIKGSAPVLIVETPSDEVVTMLAGVGLTPNGFDGQRLHDDWRSTANAVFLSQAHRRVLAG